ncbi:hypothetical protein [Nubsella zeaxanthinifaciens]|uniref:hypothetical protein n=1 Tax=Nubsella zeaxanthinifaciens TaxID=392412 RepID=UPI000DE2630A|nr:hypothetical protein [Nubsella zeaxanthinifaciens]
MKSKIMYIELKTGYSDNGPAWIGKVEFSKSGRTVYFDNKAVKKMATPSGGGNHYDIETGDAYWVSGVKKNGADRHWAGGGKIMVDRKSIDEYLTLVDFNSIEEKYYKTIDFEPTDKNRFKELENAELEL